jgi:hypothetical protein
VGGTTKSAANQAYLDELGISRMGMDFSKLKISPGDANVKLVLGTSVLEHSSLQVSTAVLSSW